MRTLVIHRTLPAVDSVFVYCIADANFSTFITALAMIYFIFFISFQRRIRYDKAYISVVQVQIVDNEFHHRCRQLSLPSATNVTEKIYEAACNAFDQGWDHAPIRLLGVSTSKATDESYEQYNLFDQDKFERLSKLNSAIDKIRDKYGDDAIVRACFAYTHKN